MHVTLFATPVPAQRVPGDDRFLGTVRTHMHKAPLTALAAGVRREMVGAGIPVTIRIVDMQTRGGASDAERSVRYGELRLDGLVLQKYRIGLPFAAVDPEIVASDVVGINANFTFSRRIVFDFIEHVARTNPRARIVVGGTDATGDSECYLRHGAHVVVKGEGEVTFSRLLQAFHGERALAAVPNIAWRENGRVVHNSTDHLRRSTAYDVRRMPPPALDLVDLEAYHDTGEGRPPLDVAGPFISVETSRGCAQACSFCATPMAKGGFRFMDLESVREHLRHLRAAGVRTLLFQEDNILSRVARRPDGEPHFPEGRRELLDLLDLAFDMEFCWEFTNGVELGQLEHEGRIDQELVDRMFRHALVNGSPIGCYRATLPLENLTDESSKLFRKLKPLGVAKQVVAAVAASGIRSLSFNVIIGRPEDDERNLKLTYQRCLEIRDVCREIDPALTLYFNVYVLSLLPGTVDYQRYEHLLAFDLDRDPEVVTFYLGCLRGNHFTPLEITQARGTMARMLNSDALIDAYDEVHYLYSERFERLYREAEQELRSAPGEARRT